MRCSAFLALTLLVTTVGACGGAPLLHGLPQPNAYAVAGIAAAAAAALTVANPGSSGPSEVGKVPNLEGDNDNRETMPNDMLDGLEPDQTPDKDNDALGAPPPPD